MSDLKKADSGTGEIDHANPLINTTTLNQNNGEINKQQTSSAGSEGGEEDHEYVSPLSPKEERRVMRKVDFALVPWLTFLYLLSFLDRSAIGNARLYGLEKSLNITDAQYNIALTVFFFPYSLFEVPSNILLKRLKPSIWFPVITMLVGVCMLSQGVVKSYGGLITARVFLGVTEAGLFPGANYLLSGWYKRSEFGIRAAIFFAGASVAGAFGGLLSAAIFNMDGIGGYEGWRWIFIIIGLITFCAGVLSFFLIPDFPDDSKFLTEDERAYVIGRLRADQQYSAKGEAFTWTAVWKGLTDWKTTVGSLAYAGCDAPLYAFSLFTPTIVKSTFPGSTGTRANLLSVPIYILACLQVLAVGFFCARYGKRALMNIICMGIGAAGYIMLLASKSYALSYASIYIAATGIYACIPNTIALTAGVEGLYKRSVVMGFIISFGNINGAVSSNIYKATPGAPAYSAYRLGHGIVLMYVCIGIISTATYWWGISRENKIRETGVKDEKILSSSIPLEERQRIAEEAHQQQIADTKAKGGILGAYKVLLAQTHSLPGGVYTSVADAKSKKGDDWSGHRYRY